MTDQDYSEDTTLTPYDPEIDEGPWWFDKKNKQHYFHGTYCLEFMFECNIELKNALSIEFVRHHSNYCSVHRAAPHNCTSRGSSGDAEGAMLLGRLAAEGSILSNETSRLVRENGKPTNALEFAFDSYNRKVGSKATFSGQVKHQSALAESLARSICALFSVRNFSDAQTLAGLFASEKDFENAIAEQIGSAAELHNWALLVG